MIRRSALVAAVLGSALGCRPSGEAPRAPEAETPVAETAARPEQAGSVLVTPEEALLVSARLERIERHLAAAEASLDELGRPGDATEQELLAAERELALVLSTELSREERVRALFDRAAVRDLRGEEGGALAGYLEVLELSPESSEGGRAGVRAVRLLTHLERFGEAGQLARRLDAQGTTPSARVALAAARALERLELGDELGAERELSTGRGVVESHGLDRVATPSRDVAALFYALGELRRRRAEAIRFAPLPADFAAVLEARCQLVLDAQAAYSETMRARDARWSAMAGVRVGGLYQSLHTELMGIEPPKAGANDAEHALFEAAMRLRYSVLLLKAERMMQTTLAMLERTGERSSYGERAAQSLGEIERARRAEEQAIDALPYSREQLRAVLRDLDRRHGGQGQL